MDKLKLSGIIILFVVLLSGCNLKKEVYVPTLPKDYLEIQCYDWQSEDVEEDNCLAFTYDNREYLFYSNVEGTVAEDDIKECIGCTVYDSEVNDKEMILSLSYSNANDYLLVYHAGSDFMSMPQELYRAADTRGKNIQKPNFVSQPIEGNPMYRYWKN